VDELLWETVARWLPAEADLRELAGRGPLRVVVPSRSLADHVGASLLRRCGRPLLGVRVQTLHALALELALDEGASLAGAEALFPVFVRQLARREAALREPLDELDDGYALVEANVRDLLDAGFGPEHLDALDEAVVAEAAAGGPRERARALARVAAGVAESVESGRVGHRSALFRRALERLEREPGALAARALIVHGYADATGVQADLLEALLRGRDAALLLDRPPDPLGVSREDPGVAFSERFTRRLAGGRLPEPAAAAGPVRISVWHAPGRGAEATAVARRLRGLLDAGAVPEQIAVVARSLSSHRLSLRRELRRLGVPFSSPGVAAPPGRAERRLESLCALLARRERTPAEVWLDALVLPEIEGSEARRADLCLALHAAGRPRLGDVAAHPPVGEEVELPVRSGLSAEEGQPAGRAPRRRLSGKLLAAAVGRARGLCARLSDLPDAEPLAAHLERLRLVVEDDLGWAEDAERLRPFWEDVGAGAQLELSHDDFLLYLQRRLESLSVEPLGGAGAGVQLLDAMAARARSFEHLFVVGLQRDVFPRLVTEDPLLPDGLRKRLRAVLPDLPVKGEGHDEERYLFAQLLSASPEVTLVGATTDDDGNAQALSPLVERLQLVPGVEAPRGLPAPHGAASLEAPGPLPPEDHALRAALHGERADLEAIWPLAVEEVSADLGGACDALALAAARRRILEELDAAPQARRGLGPYFGFVGPVREAADPRRRPLYVTTLERMAGCPWRAFVERLLRLAPPPDALDQLPAADPLLVGTLVHDVLEDLVERSGGPCAVPLEELRGREAVEIRWPPPSELAGLVADRARRALRDAGVALPGFERVLALEAQRRLEVARRLVGARALGAEVEGRLSVRDATGDDCTLHFRADRVEPGTPGLRLIDFKTGRPVAAQRDPQRRRDALLAGVETGERLQAPAYALGARQLGFEAPEGCYVSLSPDEAVSDEVRLASVEATDALRESFERTLGALLQGVAVGSFFPRLVVPEGEREPRRCQSCDVAEACLRGDSAARARLLAWRAQVSSRPSDAAQRALLDLWPLGGDRA
jgi:RecB family exonuclease/superfamily I DNA/RNA helicase